VLTALAALPVGALADGADILADFEDNGQVDGCYSVEEFQEALQLARADERQYGAAVDIIDEARITNVDRPGEPCGEQIPAALDADEDGGGTSIALVIGIIAVAGAAGIGAALYIQQRARRSGE